MNKTWKKISQIVGLSALASVFLSSCSTVTTEGIFYFDEENKDNLLLDYSIETSFTQQYKQGLMESAIYNDEEDFCTQVYNESFNQLLDVNDDLPLEGNQAEISYNESSSYYNCYLNISSINVNEDFQNNPFLGGLDFWHDVEENLIYLVLDEEGEWFNIVNTLNDNGADVSFVFEFPDEIVSYNTGHLIAEREYGGNIDRTRIVNQNVESSNIIHLNIEDINQENGFQIAAKDGKELSIVNIFFFSGIGIILVIALIFLLLGVKKRIARKKWTVSSKSTKDRHIFTLDNPNPDESKKKKVKNNLKSSPKCEESGIASVESWMIDSEKNKSREIYKKEQQFSSRRERREQEAIRMILPDEEKDKDNSNNHKREIKKVDNNFSEKRETRKSNSENKEKQQQETVQTERKIPSFIDKNENLPPNEEKNKKEHDNIPNSVNKIKEKDDNVYVVENNIEIEEENPINNNNEFFDSKSESADTDSFSYKDFINDDDDDEK